MCLMNFSSIFIVSYFFIWRFGRGGGGGARPTDPPPPPLAIGLPSKYLVCPSIFLAFS